MYAWIYNVRDLLDPVKSSQVSLDQRFLLSWSRCDLVYRNSEEKFILQFLEVSIWPEKLLLIREFDWF